MNKFAMSLVLSLLNIPLLGIYFIANWLRFACCQWGSPANVILLAIVPVVLVASIVFIVRDLMRPPSRVKAVIALALAIPIAIFVLSLRLG